MAMTNHERVGKALELLRNGLAPFVEREIRTISDQEAKRLVEKLSPDERLASGKPLAEWDAAALLKLMWEGWNVAFKKTLGFAERSLVSELREVRNRWAHQEAFSGDDAYRALDSVERLLTAVSAPEAAEVARMKHQLLRQQFDAEVRGERRRVGGSLVEAAASGGLHPWREVVTPHPDVATGRYQVAEFAADLWQVYIGEASDEYRDPVDFFRRTYLTESLKQLLVRAVERMAGRGGDPVVQLQTNFGGGKTHSLLALYHLFSGLSPAELPGVEELLAEAGVEKLPRVNRVVLVGNRLSPGNPTRKPDGTEVRTLWGELAWQLGEAKGGAREARKAFDRIRADDERATSPGDRLRELLRDYAPCLVLIDEWVAYARQLHDGADLPGGSFDTQFTFAQALTEAAKAVPRCLVVVSLPASESGASPQTQDAEVGGLRGREALERLRNVIGRVEASWRPASAEESFGIVRRRLFEPLNDPEAFKARDVTARAFAEFYRRYRSDFPAECSEADYEKRIQDAYPIHPEVFDRLYTDWSTLLTFQRTRGVLRLMAAVIHVLWERGDKNPLILPSTIPLDEPQVQAMLTRYLPENWAPVIERDVDGPNSLPVRLDGETPNLGKYAATRRVARTIFLGSAPIQKAAHQGLEDKRVHLGCVMPGEPVAAFGDALRRLAGSATYLYQDGQRYWYATQPTVAKLAEDRAEQLLRDPDAVAKEIENRVRKDVRQAGEFARVHPFPQSSADVPDDPDARLVVLGTSTPHAKREESPALAVARQILATRGSAPRTYANSLVFLAPDRSQLQDLEAAVRRFLAWDSILRDKEVLDLSPFQVRNAEERRRAEEAAVQAKLPEVYRWLLVPVQEHPQAGVTLEAIPLHGDEGLAVRAGRKLVQQELLLPSMGGVRLRMELDRVPLWRGNHVEVRQLVEDFARYVYLPRLKGPAALAAAVSDGVGQLTWEKDGFAYAEAFDQGTGRYRGLKVGTQVRVTEDDRGLVVKPEVARRQLEAESAQRTAAPDSRPVGVGEPKGRYSERAPAEEKPRRPKRFHGSVVLSATRAGRDASQIAEEVIAHLVGLPGAEVTVTLEIEALIPDGAPENVVRTVTENAVTLKFRSAGFEAD